MSTLETTATANLRALREAAGWSRQELVDRANAAGGRYYATTITRLETGERAMRVEDALVFAEVFRVPVGDFITRPIGTDGTDMEARRVLAELHTAWKEYRQAWRAANDAQEAAARFVRDHEHDNYPVSGSLNRVVDAVGSRLPDTDPGGDEYGLARVSGDEALRALREAAGWSSAPRQRGFLLCGGDGEG